MRKAWNKIGRMIKDGRYVHRKGFRLSDVELPFVLSQAQDEMDELRQDPDDPEEMADLIGVLIHYCIKQGWTMELIEKYLIEKLDLRFSKLAENE